MNDSSIITRRKRQPTNLYQAREEQNQQDAARARASGDRGDLEALTTNSKEFLDPNALSVGFGVFTGYLGCYYSPNVVFLHEPFVEEGADDTLRIPNSYILQFKRVNIPKDFFLDKIHRNFLSGVIVAEGVRLNHDFDFVDLQDRPSLEGTPQSILEDEFLFRAIPLPLRTWFYHSTFEDENSIDAMVRLWNEGQKPIRTISDVREDILNASIVEGSTWKKGRYSPGIACIIACMTCCFSIDKNAFAVLSCLLVVCVSIAKRTNNARLVNRERLYSLLFRVGTIIWIWTMGTSPPIDRVKPITTSSIPGTFRLCCGAILFIDVILGDIWYLFRRRTSGSRYKVRLSLEGRVFVCEALGSLWHQTTTLSSAVIGTELFEEQSAGRPFVLIADIDGILVYLKPLTLSDLPSVTGETVAFLPLYSTKTFENLN
jgi:hypothetical protein